MSTTTKTRKYTILPVTRVEGHGKVTIHMNEEGEVEQARLHIIEFRGFERFILGRPYWEVPVIVQRLCGICPVSHHLASAKAMDRIVGGERLTPTAEKVRRLMHHGQMFQSHALHFFHLSSPDFLFGTDGTASSAFGAPVAQRNVLAVAGKYPQLAVQGVMMRRYGQEIIRATAGKKIHGTGAIPGGVNKNLSLAERDALLKEVEALLEARVLLADLGSNLLEAHTGRVEGVGVVAHAGSPGTAFSCMCSSAKRPRMPFTNLDESSPP